MNTISRFKVWFLDSGSMARIWCWAWSWKIRV